MAAPGEHYAQHGGHPQMDPHQQQAAFGYGGAPAGYDPLTWVPPPGWVAPPGWNEYQQFVQFQRASQKYAFSPIGGGSQASLAQQQQAPPAGYIAQPPYPVGSNPAAGVGYPPQQMGAGGGTPYGMYQPSPYPPPHPQYVVQAGSAAAHQAPYGYAYPPQYPAGYYQQAPGGPAVVPQPEPIHHPKPAQHPPRPAPPPEPAARAPRVKVEFEDESSDEEGLARHDTLGVFDLVDVHEISDRDFAQLDTGTEQGVQDAGIIEGGIPVQPAITLKDSTSRESTTMPVQSINIDEATLKEVEENSDDDEDDKSTRKDTGGSSDKPENGESPPVPVSRQNSAAAVNPAATPPRRKSTFGTILGAAAALLGSSSARRLSTKGSQARATDGSSPIVAAAAAAALAAPPGSASEAAAAGGASSAESPVSAPAIPPSRGSSFQELSSSSDNNNNDAPATPSTSDSTAASTPATGAAAPVPPVAGAAAAATESAAQEDEDEGIVQIKVRTLAGKAAIFEVDKLMTLWEFRELIHEHFNNIPVEEQRLLFKGKMIEILLPETTLQDIGFVNNDLIHLVRTVGAGKGNNTSPASASLKAPSAATNSTISLNSAMDDSQQIPQVQSMSSMPAPPQQQQQQQPLQMLTVLVPPGRGPGDRLRILPQGRGPMLVTVPAGVFAGDRFRVLLPPEDPAELRRAEQLMQAENQRQQDAAQQQRQQSMQPQSQQQGGGVSRPQIMAVVVPKGFKAGQVMDVNVPGKGRVRVTIPSGVKAGQQFKFRLPS